MVGSAEAWMGFLATHRPAGRATQRQERHRAYLSWESGPRGWRRRSAMTPTPCSWVGFTWNQWWSVRRQCSVRRLQTSLRRRRR